jgi:hypothetical protein
MPDKPPVTLPDTPSQTTETQALTAALTVN